ncbi:MAG: hypothetical protein HYW01_01960 [Deltaproteobacteria bacterium]|nr:hypothetical protein [Deltaproteobacteria bacterium]
MKQKSDSQKHLRRSIRLKGYDYSLGGAYFVTICVKERKFVLEEINNSDVTLSPIGEIVYRCWSQIPSHFNFTRLDVFVIMPNHLHGVIVIADDCRGVQLNAPTTRNPSDFYKFISPKRKTLPIVIRTFKAAVTTQYRKNNYHSFEWQRNYYEYIIRNEDELNRIREYIIDNPLQWQFDRENPEQVQDKSYYNKWSHFEESLYCKTK